MKCPNCNNTLSCGCQKRVASDGTQVCTSCIASYEIKIHKPKANVKTEHVDVPRQRQDTAPVINSISVQLGSA